MNDLYCFLSQQNMLQKMIKIIFLQTQTHNQKHHKIFLHQGIKTEWKTSATGIRMKTYLKHMLNFCVFVGLRHTSTLIIHVLPCYIILALLKTLSAVFLMTVKIPN